MPRTEFNLRCGGAAGEGIASMGEILISRHIKLSKN